MDLRDEVAVECEKNRIRHLSIAAFMCWLLLIPVAVQANSSLVVVPGNWPATIANSFSSTCNSCHTMDNDSSRFAAGVGTRSASGATIEITRTNGSSISNTHYWRYRMASGAWSSISNSGTRTEAGAGNFEYCVVENADGVGQGGERDWACGTFQISNAAPQISSVNSISVTAGLSASLSVTATDDVAVTSLTAVSQNPQVATVSNSGSPFTVTALSGQQGNTAQITLTATDGDGATTTETVQVNVTAPANSDPSLSINPSSSQTLTSGETLSVQATGSDDDESDTLTYSASSDNSNIAAVSGNGSGNFTITAGDPGTTTITFTVDDGRDGFDSKALSVTVSSPINQPPSISLSVGGNVTVGAANTINVIASGSDPDGDSLTYSASSGNQAAAVVVSDGSTNGFSITGILPGSSTTVTFTVDDGRGESTSATVNVTVEAVVPENQDPTIALNPSSQQTVTVGGSFQVQVNVSDPDGDALTTSAVSSNSSIVSVSGSGSTFTLSANSEGSATVEFLVNDGRGGVAAQSIGVTVEAEVIVNTPPVISLNPSAQQSVTVGGSFQVLVSVSDADGDSLTTSASSANNGVVSVAGSGTTYTLSANAVGSTSVEFTVSDGRGGEASQSINVNVEPEQTPNTPPSLSLNSDANQAVALGSTLQISSSATDVDGDSLTFSAQSLNSSIATVSGGGSTGDFTVQALNVGATTIRISVNDGNGGSDSADLQLNVEAPAPEDQDLDSVADAVDNCPADPNPVDGSGQQTDTDGDGAGDVCDIDADGDGSFDGVLQAVVTQNNRNGNITFAADGEIDVVAGLTRGRTSGGTAIYDWSTSDASLLAVSQTNPTNTCEGLSVQGDDCGRLNIDPSGLQAGMYRARLTLDDNGLTTATTVDIVVRTGSSGSFNDFSDNDGDGIPAFVDENSNAADSIPLSTDLTNRSIRVETGSRVSIGRFAALHSSGLGFNPTSAILRFDQFRDAAISILGNLPDSGSNTPQAASGVYDFKIATDAASGQSLSAVLQLLDSVPAGAQLRIFRADSTWQAFSGGADSIRAAVPVDGSCPVTSMQERYALAWGNGGDSSTASGRSCLFFQWQDGGANDADGLRNGVVSVVFSVGESLECSDDCATDGSDDLELDLSDDGGGAAGIAMIMFLLALLLFSGIWKRRNIAFNTHNMDL